MDKCYDERSGQYKCDDCAFSIKGNSWCASPSRGDDFKPKWADLSVQEKDSIRDKLRVEL